MNSPSRPTRAPRRRLGRTRYYDPALGRFTQPDPVPGGAATAYDYAGQDPINKIDIDGTVCGHGAWERTIPDTLPFVEDFGPACRFHDRCYGTWGTSRRNCDDKFLHMMRDECTDFDWNPFHDALFAHCLGVAELYYKVVRGSAGRNAFRDSQLRHCPIGGARAVRHRSGGDGASA